MLFIYNVSPLYFFQPFVFSSMGTNRMAAPPLGFKWNDKICEAFTIK